MSITNPLRPLLLAGLSLLFTACTSIGPDTIPRDRFDYASAITESWKEQMLRNIVQLRYGEPPVFMEVASIINQYEFSGQLEDYLTRCRRATSLPLAVGFGVQDRADIDFLRGKADIAVIGSQTIRIVDEQGTAAVRDFVAGLR